VSRVPAGRLAAGPRGAVAAGHPLAAQAGAAALAEGGNAVDAVLAMAATAWVAKPDMCGPAGDLFALIREPDGTVVALNGAGPAPREGFTGDQKDRAGLTLVPGALPAFVHLARARARLPLARLLAPALAAAGNGVAIGTMLAEKLAALPAGRFRTELLEGWGVTRAVEGAVYRWPALAATLRTLAASGDPQAATLAAVPDWQARGAKLGAADVAAFAPAEEAAPQIRLTGWTIHGHPPMSQSVATLGALLRGGQEAIRADDGAYRDHVLIEAYKRAYAHLDRLGDDGTQGEVVTALIDATQARRERESIGPLSSDGPPMDRNYGETTQCAAVDAEGRVVTLIHSLYRPFGAQTLSPGTGLIANDRGGTFSGGANAPGPGKRPRHTLVGLVASHPDHGAIALGTPGAQAQTQTTLQVLSRMMRDPDDPWGAVRRPRWSFIGGRRITVESGMDPAVMRALADAGHELALRPERDWLMGSIGLVAFRDGLCIAAADDRREAIALAV